MTGLGTGTKILYIVLGIISCIAGVWLFMYPGLTEPFGQSHLLQRAGKISPPVAIALFGKNKQSIINR
ncbi:hypothetical protein, partial [Dubosiella newyorkensis]|uniref:hypothetical protein n=1 Tax=Dubosiella newyorkensis TaxID=1862672 RepID=UPI002354EF7B